MGHSINPPLQEPGGTKCVGCEHGTGLWYIIELYEFFTTFLVFWSKGVLE